MWMMISLSMKPCEFTLLSFFPVDGGFLDFGAAHVNGYGSIPIFIPFLVGYSHPFTSYFDVNRRGTWF